MYTEPKIISSEDISQRAYILYYYNGERHREYNGNKLNLKLYPNKATTLTDKQRLLRKLLYEFNKALESGWSPVSEFKPVIISFQANSQGKSVEEAFAVVLKEKLNNPFSKSYKRELQIVCSQFLLSLNKTQKDADIKSLSVSDVEAFLESFKSSATYYMFKRRTLAVIFSSFKRKGWLLENLTLYTSRIKAKATLHAIYSREQLRPLLDFLKETCPNLYLCCLLTYGCLLRPHQEIRLLKKRHFNKELTLITLSGAENKSANIRTVYIPDYVKLELKQKLASIDDDEINIISLHTIPYNDFYFTTQWNRLRKLMLQKNLIKSQQTIYSFRHTAAVNIYTQTKDLNLLKELMGHSDMLVTLKYLRGLGVVINEANRNTHAEL